MSPALTVEEALYFQAQLKLNEMLAACQSQAERDQVMAAYVQLRHNYFLCIDRTFHDDDPELVALVTQAEKSVSEIQKIEEHLGDIAKVINVLTTAVTYGAKIASKVITL